MQSQIRAVVQSEVIPLKVTMPSLDRSVMTSSLR